MPFPQTKVISLIDLSSLVLQQQYKSIVSKVVCGYKKHLKMVLTFSLIQTDTKTIFLKQV